MKRWTVEELARMIDHTYVKADATRKQMEKLCKEAREYHFAMAAINSSQTALCAEYLRDSDIHVGAAIGFPLGQTTIAAKVFEAEDAIQNGADEIDYMINLTEVKAGNWEYVKEEMQQIVTVCRNNGKLCKVILETCYLTKDEIKQMCKIAVAVKPDFVKTSTGFGSAGATAEDVALMRRCVGTAVKVKASGGIRDARIQKNGFQWSVAYWDKCRGIHCQGAADGGLQAQRLYRNTGRILVSLWFHDMSTAVFCDKTASRDEKNMKIFSQNNVTELQKYIDNLQKMLYPFVSDYKTKGKDRDQHRNLLL